MMMKHVDLMLNVIMIYVDEICLLLILMMKLYDL
jgi:hypothetical protein